MDKALGIRIDLNEKQVTSLALSSPGNDSICPGEQVPLVITATLASGEQFQTEGAGGGKVIWSSFIVETRGAHLAPKGLLRHGGKGWKRGTDGRPGPPPLF